MADKAAALGAPDTMHGKATQPRLALSTCTVNVSSVLERVQVQSENLLSAGCHACGE